MPDTADTLFINSIFSSALEKKATDIHLIAGNYPVLRLDNKLYSLAEEKLLTVDTIIGLVEAWLSPEEKEHLRTEREVRTIYTWADRARFRAAVFYQQGYPAVSFRLIAQHVPDVKELQLPQLLIDKVSTTQGLIIVSGPFNSGRSTTTASLIQYLNATSSKRIVTFEHPIEFVHVNNQSLISQRQIGRDTPSYIDGMKELLEEDVDVVLVTEATEAGIQETVLTLVESGKVVILEMNAHSSIATIDNFLAHIQKDRRQWAKEVLATSLLAVVVQRLVPAIGGGRIIAYELLTMNPAVASIIQEEKFTQLNNVLQTSRDEGMISLDYRLYELAKAGKISAADAKAFALDQSPIS